MLCYNEKMTDETSLKSIENTKPDDESAKDGQKSRLWIFILIAVVILLLIATAIFFLFRADPAVTTQIRDIFIIVLALEFFVLGAALIIMLVQLAKLINLLQNEVKPILNSTIETVNTLKGTTSFLSEQLVEPVIKLNSYLAGLKKTLELLNLFRK